MATPYYFTYLGLKYVLKDGDIYRIDGSNLVFMSKMYDPNWFNINYVNKSDGVYRVDSGNQYKTSQILLDDFSNIKSITDIFNPTRLWTEMTLQSPLAKTPPDYVSLWQAIVKGTQTFRDNKLTVIPDVKTVSKNYLQFYSVAPSTDMVTAKCRLGSGLMFYKEGDKVFMRQNYMLQSGLPFSVFEIESSWLDQWPGVRIFINDDLTLGVELKWLEKKHFTQKIKKISSLKWIDIRLYLKLSSSSDGIIQLWQDGTKIIDVKSQTMPFPEIAYDTIGIGIPANRPNETTVIIDKFGISNKKLW